MKLNVVQDPFSLFAGSSQARSVKIAVALGKISLLLIVISKLAGTLLPWPRDMASMSWSYKVILTTFFTSCLLLTCSLLYIGIRSAGRDLDQTSFLGSLGAVLLRTFVFLLLPCFLLTLLIIAIARPDWLGILL